MLLKRLSRRLRALVQRDEVELELDEELRYHLERQIEQNVAGGMSPEEARAAALRAFDGLEPSKEACRDARRVRWIEDLAQDVRYGARTLRKSPGFALVAVVTLALGIGANTAIFSVVDGVLLRPLAFREPDRLVLVWTDNPAYQLGFHEFPAANADLPEWRETATSFDQLAVFEGRLTDVSDDGDPERVGGVSMSANLLSTLGVRPALGREFSAEEDRAGANRVAMISYDLWQRRYGGDPTILGKTVSVNRVPRTIVGVLPEGFNFPRAAEMPKTYNLSERTDLWLPMAKDAAYWQDRGARQLAVIVGRLKDGVTLDRAQTEMDTIAAGQAAAYPETHEGWRVWLTPMFNQIVGETRTPLLVLLGAVGVLLLIACANIANLLLARASTRRREVAVRTAVGARRGRVVRQLLTESLLLALVGGGLGLAFGHLGLSALLAAVPPNVPRLEGVSLDTRVFLFTAALSTLTGVLFGLVPALQASKVNLVEALKDAGRSSSAGRGARGHSLLVTAEVALVAVLLVGAVLMLQSFRRLLAVDPGFEPRGVATFDLCLPWARYGGDEERAQLFVQAHERLRSLPGVRTVGAVSRLPLSGNEKMNWFAVEGAEPAPRGKEPLAEDRVITPGYFAAMEVGLVTGRDVDATDDANAPPVAVVNEALARQFFPDGAAVGRRVKWLSDGEWRTIVGVVRDVRGFALDAQPRPQFYYPLAQRPRVDSMSLVIRADATALPSLRAAIQRELTALDPALPVANFRTMPQLVAKAVARPRFSTLLLGLFAATALVLTVVGLYGVVAYGVTQRTREIGIRMALGARRRDVLSLIVRQSMRPALVGLCVGLLGAFALARLLASQFFEVDPTDPATFAGVGAILFLVGLAACYLPARRATRVSPTDALRLGD